MKDLRARALKGEIGNNAIQVSTNPPFPITLIALNHKTHSFYLEMKATKEDHRVKSNQRGRTIIKNIKQELQRVRV